MVFNKNKMYGFKFINWILMLFGRVLVFHIDNDSMIVSRIEIRKIIDYS